MISILKKIIAPPMMITFFILSVGIYASYVDIPFLADIDLKTIDIRFKIRGIKKTTTPVVLAIIDEKSIKNEGKWVWPRSKIADLVKRLSDAGARVIAFDIVFSEPDDQGIAFLKEIKKATDQFHIRNPQFTNYLSDLEYRADNDQLLADAIRHADAEVVLGNFFHVSKEDTAHITKNMILQHEKNMASAYFQQVRYSSEAALDAPLLDVQSPESNIAKISDAVSYSGFFNMLPDKDGVIRWEPAIFRYKDLLFAHLSLKALSAFTGQALGVNINETGVASVQIGDTSVPTDEFGRIMINYRGPEKTFPRFSVTDILNDRVPPANFKDKLVLVGATAIGIYDLRVTPFEAEFPGVEIHANLIDTILSQDFLYQPVNIKLYDILIMIMLGSILGILLPRIHVLPGAVGTLLMMGGYIWLCQHLFNENGLVLNMIYPLSVLLLMYLSISAYRYFIEENQKRFIKNAFSTYLSPDVVNQLIASPEKLVLGGEERQITAFFSDVAGFTSISEKLSPTALVDLLNEFLTEMSEIIQDKDGLVDKYEGDAIIAMFGAPNDLENHAQVACAASIDMQDRLSVLRKKWEKEKGLVIRMRIGLCSGSAVVGNMGSKNRMDYTMMGDTVNTAARLEGVNKVYGTYTMLSETTFAEAKHSIVARELDSINVVGKAIPVKIYQLIGYKGKVDDEMMQIIDFYEKGLKKYRQCHWDAAIADFEHALALHPEDAPSQVMLDRCREYKISPPDASWNGAYIMRTK